MRIELKSVSKRYRNEWVLRQVELALQTPQRYAVTGPNGSGKSTLLRLISGQLSPSKGQVSFFQEGRSVDPALVYRHLSFAAPYMELIEEFTLQEAIAFHTRFKPLTGDLSVSGLIDLLNFQKAAGKQIRFFSSGMKQRLRLALAICSESRLLLLDEPTTNLDAQGIAWYRALIDAYGGDRLIIVASNTEVDYAFCTEYIDILQFKKRK